MKLQSSALLAAALLAGAALPTLGCAAQQRPAAPESTGQYVDSSVITTRVKAAILEEKSLKSFQISVETFKDVVQLSGFVDSSAAVKRAGQVAAGVPGVASVRNDLIVK